MFNRRPSDIASTEIEPVNVIESGKIPPVIQSAHRQSIRQLRKKLPLAPNPLTAGVYDALQRFDIDDSQIEIGRVGEDAPCLTGRQTEHFFSVSFVALNSAPSTETRMATGTEIAQNRVRVIGLTALSIPSGKFDAFQESVANGIGNALGYIAEGRTYSQYRSYVYGEYADNAGLGGHEDGSGGMIIAPHLLVSKNFYESVADGEMPSAKQLAFKPIMPR